MNNEIKINRVSQSITFVNNGIAFSQFGIAKEILDLIESQQQEVERLNNIINELGKEFDKELKNLSYREEKLYTQGIHDTIIDHKYLLQELKGSGKE